MSNKVSNFAQKHTETPPIYPRESGDSIPNTRQSMKSRFFSPHTRCTRPLAGVLVLMVSLLPMVSAQARYAFRHYDMNSGLSHNTVNAIVQDRQGFMWIGSSNGLNRFDGVSFKTYVASDKRGQLGNDFITSLYAEMGGGNLDRYRGGCLSL